MRDILGVSIQAVDRHLLTAKQRRSTVCGIRDERVKPVCQRFLRQALTNESSGIHRLGLRPS